MSSCVKGKHLIDQYSELLFLAYDHVKYSTNYISMIMLDMEVISFALDSSANQSAATGSEEQIKIRFTILLPCTM